MACFRFPYYDVSLIYLYHHKLEKLLNTVNLNVDANNGHPSNWAVFLYKDFSWLIVYNLIPRVIIYWRPITIEGSKVKMYQER